MDNSTFLDSEELLLNVEDDFSSDQLIPSRQNFSSFLEAVRKWDHINLMLLWYLSYIAILTTEDQTYASSVSPKTNPLQRS